MFDDPHIFMLCASVCVFRYFSAAEALERVWVASSPISSVLLSVTQALRKRYASAANTHTENLEMGCSLTMARAPFAVEKLLFSRRCRRTEKKTNLPTLQSSQEVRWAAP